jgi:ABC-type proline/glycine betaine transport system permease subunit
MIMAALEHKEWKWAKSPLRLLETVMLRCLGILVPEPLQHDPIVFVRSAIVQLLPPLYIFAMWLAFYGFPARLLPPWWNLALYASFPVFVRFFRSYQIPAWLFIAVQQLSSVYLAVRVLPPASAYLTTAFFMPYVALVLLGRRVGLFCAAFSVVLFVLSHVVTHTPSSQLPVLMQTEVARRAMVRNWVMVILTAGLHRALTYAVNSRTRAIVHASEQMFASLWYCVPCSG